ncbi:MAG: undecaprenyl-diphosphate phosphatase [Phycisphaerae bacterium]|nr:undecaprenyl-diphosphate phosphatase [Phycisphaerae bacterium]NUQ47659.1 undecaprenyl-diphosphate phosphatase [Phycisphaerae bacterium]
MSDWMRALLLGVIEGLTEFLPVSSTGHMILAAPPLGVDLESPTWKAFLYFIQIGAILAVVLYFRKPFFGGLLARPTRHWTDHLAVKLLAAFMPSALVGLLLHDVLERYLEHATPVAVALILGAGLMEVIERGWRGGKTTEVADMSLSQAMFVGAAQCVSIVPGTSRAMTTIMGGLLAGLSPRTAAVFSFYLAIPTIMAAGGYSLVKHRRQLRGEDAELMAVGFVTAFVVAWLVVNWFMTFVQTHRLRAFAIYRVILGALILAVHAWHGAL